MSGWHLVKNVLLNIEVLSLPTYSRELCSLFSCWIIPSVNCQSLKTKITLDYGWISEKTEVIATCWYQKHQVETKNRSRKLQGIVGLGDVSRPTTLLYFFICMWRTSYSSKGQAIEIIEIIKLCLDNLLMESMLDSMLWILFREAIFPLFCC
jgi:hypothetical protein